MEAAHRVQFVDRHANTSMMSQADPTQRDRYSLLRSLSEVLDGLAGISFDTCRTRESNRGAERESENEYEKSRGAESVSENQRMSMRNPEAQRANQRMSMRNPEAQRARNSER